MKPSIPSAALGLLGLSASLPVWAQDASVNTHKTLTLSLFAVIVGITLMITYWAARRTHSTAEFYAAGRSITGFQNGLAIAGDYLSAASFLGIAGLIALYGYDGFMYSVGFLMAYITVLLLIAEPCRNTGKYTMADILAFRSEPKKVRTVAALSTIIVSTFYLTAQMVGAGSLIKLLIGIPYETSVIIVGIVMLAYVVFGGMLATTWVQIIKAVILIIASFILVLVVWGKYGFSLPGFLNAVVNDPNIQNHVAKLLGDKAAGMSPEELGQRFLEPGLFLKNPIDQLSLGMALVFGTAGLPHILMRFYTVPTARAARTSVIWAMILIGGFYVMTLFLGLGAALNVGPAAIIGIDKGGNMAAPLLAQYVGGGPESMLGNFFLAFVAAVAFATIVAVVAGLVLAAASAMAHDLYVGVIKGEHASAKEQVRAARVATVLVGILAIVIGIAAKGQNVAHLVGLAFAVAASANLPVLLLTLHWKRFNTGGVIAGMLVGATAAIVLVLVSPNMTYPLKVKADAEKVVAEAPARRAALQAQLADPAAAAKAQADLARLDADVKKAEEDIAKVGDKRSSLMGLEKPLFELKNPGIVSIPLGFLAAFIGSLLYRDKRAEEMWDELYVRQNTGIHAE
ncbi:cation acetate symporter [Thermithiobacillus plumbiphilus]|uniref:Cation acetate symporter n=1 Tax=Thermithiobacillus plumbiphilus TaxID=1729899 RepID=A0ABU9DA44_9PROT